MNKKSLKGFTLVEMLIVVVIVGVLISVAVPQYRVATAKARVASVLPIMRKVREAQQLYWMEYRYPACDLAKLNLRVDYVDDTIREYNVQEKGEDGKWHNKKDANGNEMMYRRLCGIPQNDYTGDIVHSGGANAGQTWVPWLDGNGQENPDFENAPLYNGVTPAMLGYAHAYTLKSKDSFILTAHKLIYGDASNNITIDYHLLGTTGEVDGQWSFTGCFDKGERCDAVCSARTEESIWGKVCRSLSNGECAYKDKTRCQVGHPNGPALYADDSDFPGKHKGVAYCIKGAAQQNPCPIKN